MPDSNRVRPHAMAYAATGMEPPSPVPLRMRVDLDAKQVQALVDVRMNRQNILAREDAPKLWAVIDEAAFRRIESKPAVLKEQLEHLLDVEPRTNITLQLLPFDTGFHPGLYGSFMLMGFPEPNPDVVRVENLTNSVYFEGSGPGLGGQGDAGSRGRRWPPRGQALRRAAPSARASGFRRRRVPSPAARKRSAQR